MKYYGFVTIVLMTTISTASCKSLQDISPMEVDYEDSSMDIDENVSQNSGVCTADGCYNAAELILNNINKTADPCNNFFEFACGGFVSRTTVSESKPSIGHLNQVQETVIKEISNLLQDKIHPDEPRIFKLAKKYYQTCLSQTYNDNTGLFYLSNIVGRVGGWPLILGDSWREDSFNWAEVDIKLRKFGFIPQNILKLYVFNDLYNSSRSLLHIAPATLELSPKLLKSGLNDRRVHVFYNFMIQVATYFGADRVRAQLELADVLNFEIQLAYAESATYTGLTKNFTIRDLETHVPIGSWLKYLNGLIEPSAHFEMDDVVHVENPNHFNQLASLLLRTPKRTIANYMIWKIIFESLPYLNTELRDIHRRFLIDFNGKKIKPMPRWKECTSLLMDKTKGITVGVSSLYIRKFFDDETKREVQDIVHAIGNEFKLMILKLPWLDDTAKINAIKKSLFMKQIVGYPDQLKNDKVIDKYSRHLRINSNNFFKSVLNVQKFHYEHSVSGLNGPIDERSWLSFADSTQINAYYYSVFNSFVLLAAFLRPPLFNRNWPSYVKYGSIGFIIGHETMHAYDAGRIFYDETGSYNPQFTLEHQVEYEKRISCYIKQYDQFMDDELGLHVDGRLTINENLADNVGIKVAYNAYKTWEREHTIEEVLPGLGYTQEQIFWISSANFLCSKDTAEHRVNLLLTEEHTPDKFRALGHVSNLDEFAKAFNCPVNSPMNPQRKCSLA